MAKSIQNFTQDFKNTKNIYIKIYNAYKKIYNKFKYVKK